MLRQLIAAIPTVLAFFLSETAHAQQQPEVFEFAPIFNDSGPRTKKDSQHPGTYEILGHLSRSAIFKKDDTTKLRIAITGYGEIKSAKLYYSCSEAIFSESSPIISGYTLVGCDTGVGCHNGFFLRQAYDSSVKFGAANIGVMNMGGVTHNKWSEKTYFFDVSDHSDRLAVFSEIAPQIPANFHLVLKDSVPSGDYNFNLVFTYFNGVEWKSSTQSVPIHVNSVWEEYPSIQVWLSCLAIAYAAIALFYQIREFNINQKDKAKDSPGIIPTALQVAQPAASLPAVEVLPIKKVEQPEVKPLINPKKQPQPAKNRKKRK